MEAADYTVPCDRCGVKVDSRAVYSQLEKTRFGGKIVPVKAHYCKACHGVLSAVGAGEHTALDERAADIPSFEPTTKTDR